MDRDQLQEYLSKTHPNLKLIVSPTLTNEGFAMARHQLGSHIFIEALNPKHIRNRLISMLEDEIKLINIFKEILEKEKDGWIKT